MKMAVTVPEMTRTRAQRMVRAQPEQGHTSWVRWPVRTVVLLLLVLGGSVLWNKLSSIEQVEPSALAVAVPRAQSVVPLADELPLRIGNIIVINGRAAPIMATIKGLPLQSIPLQEAHNAGGFMVLGADRYYVVCPNGEAQVVQRAHIRGVVQNRCG